MIPSLLEIVSLSDQFRWTNPQWQTTRPLLAQYLSCWFESSNSQSVPKGGGGSNQQIERWGLARVAFERGWLLYDLRIVTFSEYRDLPNIKI